MTRIGAAAIFLAAFLLYLTTLHPAFQLDDSPETIAACVNLGFQHAPGYPLLTLLGKLASVIPAGGTMFRINLLAALLGAGCCVGVARWTASLLPGARTIWIALSAAAILGTSRIFWECALSAKGGMYLLHLGLILACCAASRPLAAAVWFGLALANHWMSAVWWLPGLVLLCRPWTPRRAALAGVVVVLGASLYLQLPLSASREPAWGDPVTPAGLLAVILRRDFLPQAALKPAIVGLEQMGYALLSPIRDGGLLVLLVALAGAPLLWRARPARFSALGAGALLTLGAVSVLANPVHIPTGEPIFWLMDRFFLPWTAVAAIGCGAGLFLLVTRLPSPWHRAGWLLAAALPLGLLAANGPRNNHARDYLGYDYSVNLLTSLRHPATILAEADYQSFPLFAILGVEQRDPAVRTIITNPFLNRRWGWRRLTRRIPETFDLAVSPAPFADRVAALAERLAARDGVYHLSMCSYPEVRRRLQYHGIVSRYTLPADTGGTTRAVEPLAASFFRTYRLRGLHGSAPYKDETAFSVLDVYCLALAHDGDREAAAGRLPEAITGWRRGLTIPGRIGHAMLWTSIGNAAGRLDHYAEAEDAFRRAAKLRPHDLDLWANVATACAAQGKSEEAFRWFGYVLSHQPNHRAALANRAALLRRLGG